MIGTCSLVTGAPGAGKTLGWVKWLCDDFLCRDGGNVVTNISLHPDKIGAYVEKRCNTFLNRRWGYAPSSETVSGRIILLGDDDCLKLRDCQDVSKFFGDIENTYICLDEFHTFCSQGSSGLVLKNWANWLATLRHHHASICAISQDVSQIDRVYKSRVECRIEFLSADSQYDPYFRIPVGDWASLVSALRGAVVRPNVRASYTRGINGRWVLERMHWDFIDRSFFEMYDSWQKGKSVDG